MKLKILKLWHDPVWSKVIAGTILAIGSLVMMYFFDVLTVIRSLAGLSVKFALSTTTVPNFILIAMGFLSIPTAILVLYVIKKKILPSKTVPETPTWWNRYTSDLFFGLRWRWKYSHDEEHKIHGVTTFCPKCDYQVYHKETTIWNTPIGFYCDCCKQQLTVINETYPALEDKTIRLIHQKIRNGTWSTQNTI